MERITRRIGESIDFIDGKGYANLSHDESTRLLFEKLAEYEDIGLKPDVIRELIGRLEEYEWKYGSVERAMVYAEYAGNL